jgi:cytochrome c oxidase subunit III
LFAFQQPNYPPGCQAAPTGQQLCFRNLLVGDNCAGGAFLWGTAREWHRLIYEKGLTIHTNLFGTTYFSLVGLHGFHVTVGLILLSVVMVLALLGFVKQQHVERLDVLSLYWHFVDTVWVVVFTVVYIIGR